jgi:non-ribosomal peptide synthetase component E (peptide arylation enzyme)
MNTINNAPDTDRQELQPSATNANQQGAEIDAGVVRYPDDVAAEYLRKGIWQAGTIAEHFHSIAVRYPDNVALVCGEESLTFAELDELSDRRAAGLIGLGLDIGERVLLQVHNTTSTVVAWYALLKAGLIPVCTLALHRQHEIGEIGRQTAPAAHLVAADNPGFDLAAFAKEEAARSGRDRIILTCGGPEAHGCVDFDKLGDGIEPAAARAQIERVQAQLGPQSVVAYQLSGGTSGVPKVIPCLQAGYWTYSSQFARALRWGPEHRVAYIAPIVHNAGIIIGLQAPHSVGAAAVLGTPNLDNLFWALTQHAATDTLLGPFAYDAVFDPRMESATALQRVLFSGKKVSEGHFAALENRGIWAGQVFGMGEGLCLTTPLDYPRAARLAGVGIPISEADEIRICHPGTEVEVPPGEVGEMCTRGPYTLRGYLAAPEHNKSAFTSDGFYRTGDLMADREFDGVRSLTVEGRIKDMISRGGVKISTAEVEVLLVAHEAVAEAAVVPMPDPRLGERACAFLVGAGGRRVELADIQKHLESLGVAKYKWPERILWLDEMPRASQVGKIDRRVLRETAADAVAAESIEPIVT